MGLARLDRIVAQLLEHGAPGTRPAALIAQASTEQQRVIVATLEGLSDAVARAAVESPALLVVGDVAALHASLAWFSVDPQVDLSRSA
jgi:uroporphyrin-III C-methyltransferase/precorrin-2 dehydrogenase/sirohydrochlorin ferrochelatase